MNNVELKIGKLYKLKHIRYLHKDTNFLDFAYELNEDNWFLLIAMSKQSTANSTWCKVLTESGYIGWLILQASTQVIEYYEK